MASAWLEQGLAHYAAGRWEEAGVALERALAEQPGNPDAWYRLGNVRDEQNRDEEAFDCFSRVVALDPGHARARNNLGTACQRLGRHADAFAAYEQALKCDPSLLEPYLNLGRLCESHGELANAAGYLKAGLAHHPGHPMLVHLLAAASGQSPQRVPRDHVVAFFDDFAEQFDEHLVAGLGYQLPALMASKLRPALSPGARVLDLGCGTGLMGAALASSGAELIGIDLSPEMLKRAAARGVYSKLMVADVDDAFAEIAPASCRVVVAADVFIYLGDLARVFDNVARILEPRGLFGYSIESAPDGRFRLQSGGRFAHSPEYLSGAAQAAGLRELSAEALTLRTENGVDVKGLLVLLERL